ncbi:hypothetical protein STEG23_031211 [Scotinomys teguina]
MGCVCLLPDAKRTQEPMIRVTATIAADRTQLLEFSSHHLLLLIMNNEQPEPHGTKILLYRKGSGQPFYSQMQGQVFEHYEKAELNLPWLVCSGSNGIAYAEGKARIHGVYNLTDGVILKSKMEPDLAHYTELKEQSINLLFVREELEELGVSQGTVATVVSQSS